MNSGLWKMQSEMVSKPYQRFSSVCASIDTEVDRMIAWQQASCIFIVALSAVINIQTQ